MSLRYDMELQVSLDRIVEPAYEEYKKRLNEIDEMDVI